MFPLVFLPLHEVECIEVGHSILVLDLALARRCRFHRRLGSFRANALRSARCAFHRRILLSLLVTHSILLTSQLAFSLRLRNTGCRRRLRHAWRTCSTRNAGCRWRAGAAHSCSRNLQKRLPARGAHLASRWIRRAARGAHRLSPLIDAWRPKTHTSSFHHRRRCLCASRRMNTQYGNQEREMHRAALILHSPIPHHSVMNGLIADAKTNRKSLRFQDGNRSAFLREPLEIGRIITPR